MADAFVRLRPAQPGASSALVCFPAGGGGAYAFAPWRTSVPDDVDLWALRLPGREARVDEPAKTTFADALAEVVAEYRGLETPFAFVGHCFGALLAFELALVLERSRSIGPLHLFVLGQVAPHADTPSERMHLLPRHQFYDHLRRNRAVPDEVLADEAMMAVIEPVLRADFACVASYSRAAPATIECPISVVASTRQLRLERAAFGMWSACSASRTEVCAVDGELTTESAVRESVIALIVDRLRQQAPLSRQADGSP